jgi:hypothetical protein
MRLGAEAVVLAAEALVALFHFAGASLIPITFIPIPNPICMIATK